VNTGRNGSANGWTKMRQACFAADVEVLTARGFVRWDALTESDKVASCDENEPEGVVEFKQVEEIFRTTGRVWHVHVGGKVIRTSGEHPFYVNGLGWIPAHSLVAGYLLRSHTGVWVAVEDVFDTAIEEVVYNCRVSDHHTYFVGGIDWHFTVWAHNACDMHHGTPKEVIKNRPAHIKAKDIQGRKGKPNRLPIDRGKHQDAHNGRGGKPRYNVEFQRRLDVIERRRRLRAADYWDVRRQMLKYYFKK
jgi:hypothetical protein